MATQSWQDKAHFFAVAARVMRNILLDYARARNSGKRGGRLQREELDEALVAWDQQLDQALAVDQALERLASIDAQQARIVEMRYFGGLSVEEVGAVLGVSPRTVKREWSMAKAWLYAAMGASL